MNLYATLDTSIFGRAYRQGELVDTTGWIRAQFLQQLGLGLVTPATGTVIVNGPNLAAPSEPIVSQAPHGYVVQWDGLDENGSAAKSPAWALVQVHSSITTGFDPGPTSLKGTFVTPNGGTLVCMAGLEYELGITDSYEVLLLTVDTAGNYSLPSARVSITVGQIVPMDVPDFSLTVIKQQSLAHLLY
jgi:hypothetical protein